MTPEIICFGTICFIIGSSFGVLLFAAMRGASDADDAQLAQWETHQEMKAYFDAQEDAFGEHLRTGRYS